MDEMLRKISSYDFLNSLIPGAALMFFLEEFELVSFGQINAFVLVALAYILGIIASRVGSLVLEPLAIRLGLISRDYRLYVSAEKVDGKLPGLVAISNMYRSLAGALIVLAVLAGGSLVAAELRGFFHVGFGFICFLLLFFGWIKQERYVFKRMDLNAGKAKDNVHR